MTKVLFVCLGNICRSPMAEAVFRKKIDELNLSSKIKTSSAATSSWEAGNSPHRGTRQILKQHNISYEGIRSTPIQTDDFLTYDWIIGMDHQNVEDLKRRAPKGTVDKVQLFMGQVAGKEYEEVPDPYYTGDFETTYQMVEEGTDAWLNFLQNP